MSDFANWYNSLPQFTRLWLTLTAGFTLVGRFGSFSPETFLLRYEPLIRRFQIWRPITALFYYPLHPSNGFHFLITCYFLYTYSLRLETEQFKGRPADYLFMLVFNWLVCVLIGLIADLWTLMDPMVLSVLYVWCQLNKDLTINFWFGSRFKAMYLPWVLFAFNTIISGSGVMELVGILVGHMYFFLSIRYPQQITGAPLISTPSIFYKWFPNSTGTVHGFGTAPPAGANLYRAAATDHDPAAPRRHNWGRGHTLGDH